MKVGAKTGEKLVEGNAPPKPESPGSSARCGPITEENGAGGVAGPPRPAQPGPSREALAEVMREVQLHDMDL